MEDNNKVHPTSIYISADRLAKADRIAEARGISRNKLINLLIDSVEEISVPPVSVKLPAMKKDKVPV